MNDPDVVDRMTRVIDPIPEVKILDDTVRTMASEDMSYLLEDVPGMFFLVGCRHPKANIQYGHHHPRFDFDE